MKRVWLKYLVVFICVFSVLEKTGISVSAIFHVINSYKAECIYNCPSDKDAAERNGAKETSLKEYWDIHQQCILAPLMGFYKPVCFPGENSSSHLAWVPPVPTPPPNLVNVIS